MGTITIIATFTAIAPENIDPFKAAVRDLTGLVASEEGTLEYSFHLTADETKCLLIESYADADALMTHMAHAGHLLPQLFEAGGSVDVDIVGEAPEFLIEATKDFRPTVYAFFAGA